MSDSQPAIARVYGTEAGSYIVSMCGSEWRVDSPASVGELIASLLTQDRMAALLNGKFSQDSQDDPGSS